MNKAGESDCFGNARALFRCLHRQEAIHDEVAKALDEFLKERKSNLKDNNVYTIKGETAEVISEFLCNNDVDLVVMGSVARSGMPGVITGNTADPYRLGDRNTVDA